MPEKTYKEYYNEYSAPLLIKRQQAIDLINEIEENSLMKIVLVKDKISGKHKAISVIDENKLKEQYENDPNLQLQPK